MSKKVILACITAFLLVSCGGGGRFNADISDITYSPTFFHWEKAVFEQPVRDVNPLLNRLKKESPVMFSYYMELRQIPENNDSVLPIAFAEFIHNVYMQEAYREIKKVFPNTNKLDEELITAFKHVKFYFPTSPVPSKIIYLHTGFAFNILPDSNALGISLELYLGEKNSVIQKLPKREFPVFIKKRMRPEYMVGDALKTWTELFILPEEKPVSLLDNLIYQGKIMMVLEALLPQTPHHVKIRYSDREYAWCKEYETEIWKEIIDNKWLYSTDPNVTAQFFNEAPFTSSLPQNSPSRAGVWVGWQMVRAYMDANPDVTLPELIKEKDNRKILRFYKPS